MYLLLLNITIRKFPHYVYQNTVAPSQFEVATAIFKPKSCLHFSKYIFHETANFHKIFPKSKFRINALRIIRVIDTYHCVSVIFRVFLKQVAMKLFPKEQRFEKGKFYSIACEAKFLFTSANHTMRSLLTYPFPIFLRSGNLNTKIQRTSLFGIIQIAVGQLLPYFLFNAAVIPFFYDITAFHKTVIFQHFRNFRIRKTKVLII